MEAWIYESVKISISRIIALRGAEKIALYPYGKIGKEVKDILNKEYKIQEKIIIDNNLAKYRDDIFALEELNENDKKECYFLITSNNPDSYDEIRDSIRNYVSEDRIIDIFTKVRPFNDARIETLRLIAENLNENNIEGNVAELGVYKGEFAREINKYFKDRKLYLFDTFEGFNNKKLSKYVDERFAADLEVTHEFCSNFVNEDIVGMLSQFPVSENCIIKKGFFPETAEGIEDTFCFVSLDVDIHQGTKAGLEWFWSKLSKRGIIMIHDYNNYECPGVKQAVDEFCEEKELGLVCIPDIAGTVVLTK